MSAGGASPGSPPRESAGSAAPQRPPAILVEGLSFRYPDGTQALRDFSLRVEQGESVGLIGPNGAGKSTLLLRLNGILRPERGRVEVLGIPVEKRTLREVRRRIGLVFQDPDDQLFMPTVFDDVAFGPLNMGLEPDEVRRRVQVALEEIGALHLAQRAPYHLSGGEKRAAAIATVLSMDVAILALDEPTSGLDPHGRRTLIALLNRLGRTKLIASHDLEMILETCGRVAVVDGGRVAAEGSTREILDDCALLEAHALERPHAMSHIAGRGHA